jgi:excisionase family DNA binding protein
MFDSCLLTPAEAADYLRISQRTLRRFVASGVLPVVTMGALRRYRRSDLDEYIKASTQQRRVVLPARGVEIDFGRTDWWQ